MNFMTEPLPDADLSILARWGRPSITPPDAVNVFHKTSLMDDLFKKEGKTIISVIEEASS